MKKLLYIHTASSIDSFKANLISVFHNCNSFKLNGVEVELVMPKPKINVVDVNDYVFRNFGISLNFKITFYKPFFIRKFSKYIQSNSFKSIIKNSEAEYVFTRIPNYIQTVFNYNKKIIFESHNNKMHDKLSFVDYYWKKKVIKYVNDSKFSLFICISNNLKSYWKSYGMAESKLVALHDAIPKKNFYKKLNKLETREELGLPTEKKIVTYAGSLYPDREIENIIDLASNFPDLLFCIVGGPKKFSEYYKKISKEKKINNLLFKGQVPYSTVIKYMFSSDILLALWSRKVPTIDFCSPLKLFEYMATANLVIAHDFITIREVITHGKTGFLVNPKSNLNLIHQLKKALNFEGSKKIGLNARKLVLNKYTWSDRSKSIIKILQNDI